MKRTIIFSLLLALSLVAMARPVSQDAARRVAQAWMQGQGMKNPAALQDITAQTPFTEFYLFAAPDGGFVIVSGDDCVRPVLAYSVETRFMVENMPQHVVGFLMSYEKEIRWHKSHQSDAGQATGALRKGPGLQRAEWRALLDGVAPQPSLAVVSPLLTTTWSQSPLYNNLCPSDTAGQAVTGCVATATAQVMKYHSHPAQGYGSHTYTSSREINGIPFTYPNLTANFGNTTYQWSQMPNELTSTSTAAQVNAVATLMYHIGVADEMRYSPHASGANNYYGGSINSQRASSQESLARYFKYRPDMAVAEREAYSYDHYVTILRGELDQQRPILYSGSDETGGHSFVLDGYDNSGYFHVNWGWAGWLDGYYAIGGLVPGAGGTGANMGSYDMGNGAVLGIRPNTSWSPSSATSIGAYMQNSAPMGASATVSDRTTGSPTSVFSYGDTAVLSVTVPDGYCFSGWTDGDAFNPREVLATGGNYDFTATCEPIGLGDTVGYCRGGIHTLSPYAGGVKLPASALDTTKQLTSVMFHAYQAGTYTITVYTGANHSTTAATVTYTVGSSDANAWQTVALGTPVPATDDIWIIIENSNPNDYSVSLTTYSGVPSSFILVWNGSYYEYGANWQCTAMILGIFSSGSTPQPVDCQITTFPYTMNFEATDDLNCITVNDANQDSVTWGLIQNYGYNGTNCAYVTYAVNADDWLMLPVITTPGTYNVSWKVRAISSDWPETYQVVAMRNGVNVTLFSETITDTLYQDRTANFTVAAGDTVKLAWRYISDDKYVLFIDNIVVSEASSQPTQYTITVASNNTAWGTVTGGGTYNEGTSVTLTATANSGYHFVQWQDGNTQNPRTITVTGNATYTATFEADATPQGGDTVSYCGNSAYATNYGTGGGSLEWGIMLPPSSFNGATYLKSVMIYVADGQAGTYTLNLYRGGDTVPGTLAHTQVANFGSNQTGWQEVLIDATFTLNNQNLWITFATNGQTYPMAVCNYTGAPNSDWIYLGGGWNHFAGLGYEYSWMIKAVTTSTTPMLPAPTVSVDGQYQLAKGLAYTFNAIGTEGASITWSLPGATPSTATGSSATATWNAAGVYNIVATISNAYGVGHDTMQVLVVDYTVGDTVSYALNRQHYTNVGTGSASAFSWGIKMPSALLAGRTHLSGVMAGLNEIGSYTLTIYQGGDAAPQTQIGTYSITTTAADTASGHYFTYTLPTPLAINSASNLWVVIGSTDLAYPAGTVYHTTDTNSDWTLLNGTWYHLPQLGINGSWEMKLIMSAPVPPTQYTITVVSNNTAWGTVTGGGTYNAGATATLTATANSGYHFVQWQDGNTQNPRTITVTANATYTATFEADANPQGGDTVSYCGNSAFATNFGTNGGSLEWGIMLPPSSFNGATYLKSVMIYVAEGQNGTYTLNLYRGGDTVPGTLAHTQVANFGSNQTGWQEVLIDATFTLNNQNLWITFATNGQTHPMAVCNYTGALNSDWINLGTGWSHFAGLGFEYSWMIKAVTTSTAPMLPPPTVSVDGQYQLAKGLAYTFNAIGTEGASITWSLPGATPSTATGSSVTATWNAAGVYNIVATISNAYGVGHDTMQVLVVDYTVGDTVSYALNRPHYNYVGTGSASAFSWGIMMPAALLAGRTHLSGVMAGLHEIGNYTLTIYQGGNDAPQTQIGTYSITTTAADTASGHYFTYTLPTPLAISSTSNLWVVFSSTDLAYPAGTVSHTTDTNSDWTLLNGTWYHLPQLTINGSWEMKLIMSAPVQPTQYTITVVSNNNAWGTVTGGGTYNAGATATLIATPASGYRFVSWSDGNTQSTHTVTVTGDATYVATFEAIPPTQYTITVISNNDSWGTVTGGGTYNEGTTIQLTASPAANYRFDSWNDGNTDNPRTITVTGDATYIATFVSTVGIDGVESAAIAIVPNPATEYAVVKGLKAGTEVSVVDVNGKVRFSATAQSDVLTLDVSGLTAGVYFVRVNDGTETAVRKLIVK